VEPAVGVEILAHYLTAVVDAEGLRLRCVGHTDRDEVTSGQQEVALVLRVPRARIGVAVGPDDLSAVVDIVGLGASRTRKVDPREVAAPVAEETAEALVGNRLSGAPTIWPRLLMHTRFWGAGARDIEPRELALVQLEHTGDLCAGGVRAWRPARMHPAGPPEGRAAAGSRSVSQPSEARHHARHLHGTLLAIRRGIGVRVGADDLPAIVDIEGRR
jgi:hypothetical protein